MNQPVISVENLSKAYRIGAKEEVPDTLVGAAKGMLTAPWKNFQRLRNLNTTKQASGLAKGEPGEDLDTLWALKDVSFEVNEGDVVGIIGRNGAGKSTLLKILSRITEPTSGRAVIRGRVSSLLEVGTGFHPELTGRDNVYMNGTILGMTKKEIDRKFDEIVEFSGVEKFLDTPTKRYSSGMQVRLAFSVAAHLEPEILIVDEVLAVGDTQFQQKCVGKMRHIANGGRTVVFVSHNMAAVRSLCTSAIVINDGAVLCHGSVSDGINQYQSDSYDQLETPLSSRTDRNGRGDVLLTNVKVSNSSKVPYDKNPGLRIELAYKHRDDRSIINPRIIVGLYDINNTAVFRFDSNVSGGLLGNFPSCGLLVCETDGLRASAGDFFLNVALYENEELCDHIVNAIRITIEESDVFGTSKTFKRSESLILVKHSWEHVAPHDSNGL